MKKIFIILIQVLSLCLFTSCAKNDTELLKEYFTKYYSEVYEIDELLMRDRCYKYISENEIPGLKHKYFVHYSYTSDALKIEKLSAWTGYIYEIILDYSYLSTDYVDIPVTVSIDCDGVYTGTFTQIFRYKPYTYYFADVLIEKLKIDRHPNTNAGESIKIEYNDNVSKVTRVDVSGGYYYSKKVDIIDFNKGTFTRELTKWNKLGSEKINITEQVLTYYFIDVKPKIEGLTTGTWYVSDVPYSSEDSSEEYFYSNCKAINELFKLYNDAKYITNIS